MSHPYHHAQSSARKYGGEPDDYLAIHQWFDASKCQMANFRHRALRHHAFGIFEMEAKFGPVLTNSAGKIVPTRFIGEQHVREDCGGLVPSAQDWLRAIPTSRWMNVGDLSGDSVPHDDHGQPDLSLEAWRAAVSAGQTVMGHSDWMTRLEMVVAA